MTDASPVPAAWALAVAGIDWLAANYPVDRFFAERDVVWTLQRWYGRRAAEQALPIRVMNDFGAEPGPYRALSADIALVLEDRPPVVMEFKYEPSHARADISPGKFPVISWQGVAADAERVQRWVRDGRATAGIALLIDEGGTFAARAAVGHRWPIPAIPGGTWTNWGSYNQSDLNVHVHRFDQAPELE